jgi:hypothetical protein
MAPSCFMRGGVFFYGGRAMSLCWRYDIMGYAYKPKPSYRSYGSDLRLLREYISPPERRNKTKILQSHVQKFLSPSELYTFGIFHNLPNLQNREAIDILLLGWSKNWEAISENNVLPVRKKMAQRIRESYYLGKKLGQKTKEPGDRKARGIMCVLRRILSCVFNSGSCERRRCRAQKEVRAELSEQKSVPRRRKERIPERRFSSPLLQLQYGETSSWDLSTQGGIL